MYKVSTKSSHMYAKPYTARIDIFKTCIGYRPPKFQKFERKENPKKYVAYFVETFNNVGTDEDHIVKKFVCSLKGNAYDWYTNM